MKSLTSVSLFSTLLLEVDILFYFMQPKFLNSKIKEHLDNIQAVVTRYVARQSQVFKYMPLFTLQPLESCYKLKTGKTMCLLVINLIHSTS